MAREDHDDLKGGGGSFGQNAPYALHPKPTTEAKRYSLEEVQAAIAKECDELKAFLLDKNRKYGNSAFEPIGAFSKLSPLEGIKIRIDDKIKRMQKGDGSQSEDTVLDLSGYFVLHMVAERLEGKR